MSEKRKRDDHSDSEEEEERIPPISASKLQAFTVGSKKKTAYQKHKEETDLKKQQESLEAAKVYADFVASFEEPIPYKLGMTSFVKSGTLQPRGNFFLSLVQKNYFIDLVSDNTFKKSTFKPMPFVRAGEPASAPITVKNLADSDDEEDSLAKLREIKMQKKRNLDSFLEEIKKGQEIRSKVEEGVPSTQDDALNDDSNNPNSTNLYVGNINPTVTETGLCHEFAKYGAIASVKIMWPRTQEEKDKGNNCGFVSFMTRYDANEAIKHLDGRELEGFPLRVGWGKPVPLPAQPIFGKLKQKYILVYTHRVLTVLQKVLDKKISAQKTGLAFNAQINPGLPGVVS
ncbi:uncharacterized protein EV154DRAFT_417544 [Mucor mucedo]|uniref:uncharacterized protein n=1 Tax=Mucor mucedo TaxID=29922 RepID=UPI00221EED85|nr:uncharacterized protein EV154DRAFT_417544 [Mucor mucedo]KAI7893087.1 hypothetical protein EV154DRAFT_417544 [Mucor mucedo]